MNRGTRHCGSLMFQAHAAYNAPARITVCTRCTEQIILERTLGLNLIMGGTQDLWVWHTRPIIVEWP